MSTGSEGNGTGRRGAPDKPVLEGLEAAWAKRWADEGTYHFDPTATREQVYAIDTPPPTVSGSLHMGHIFSFTHTDTIARYKRMRGYAVWYPMGWDDNGLPTERRVQNYYGVRCDPSLAAGDGASVPERPGDRSGASPVPPFRRVPCPAQGPPSAQVPPAGLPAPVGSSPAAGLTTASPAGPAPTASLATAVPVAPGLALAPVSRQVRAVAHSSHSKATMSSAMAP